MSQADEDTRKVVPAQLGFLAIYNPSLGTTDETFSEQIVYYSSASSRARHARGQSDSKLKEELTREENNEQLRQIGLAQGMVEFGRSFSDGKSVDTIETEKSKIVLHELETGWWILASIDLTRLPSTSAANTKGKTTSKQDLIEYSSREVKPAILLLGDLLRAHATFLLHHASSMSALFVRNRRSKFIGILGRYWDTYLSTWNVLLHGNPATSLYGGIKVAACGELGVGVGEEERGSGEREVLEGFVGRIEGLVDVLVSKFGDSESNIAVEPPRPVKGQPKKHSAPWLGSGEEPAAEDGTIFLGTGALSRKSLRDVSHWVEDLYRWGPYTYGVIDNPSSNRRAKPKAKKKDAQRELSPVALQKSRQVYGLNSAGTRASSSPVGRHSIDSMLPNEDSPKSKRRPSAKRNISFASSDSDSNKNTKFLQYLKLGYGTHWSLGTSSNSNPDAHTDGTSQERRPEASIVEESVTPSSDKKYAPMDLYPSDDSVGHYLIGLLGSLEDDDVTSDLYPDEHGDDNERIVLRTLTVELERAEDARPEADISIDLGHDSDRLTPTASGGSEHTGTSTGSYDSGKDRNKSKKLRVVVYANKPFIFVFLFELRADALAWTSLYRSLHHQIEPLLKPLLRSTKYRASRPELSPSEETDASTPIYDIIWDPKVLTINSTIPNIPDPYQSYLRSSQPLPWTRIEALNTHMQIINTYLASTTEGDQLERTCKTSRGWWVVWTLIPDLEPPPASLASGKVSVPQLIAEDSAEPDVPTSFTGPAKKWSPPNHLSPRGTSAASQSTASFAHPFLDSPNPHNDFIPRNKEIFLIRRASDHVAARSTHPFSGGAVTETGGPGKLVQGIGVDTKRYIEALLNLNR